ncbi:hypothetical protein EC973_006720 [Apophysomyces ossiformis]|uniref:RRM domain-containing protein n=1 Tax=Apophysomyces ossiformis TaxID=679940 RepID=A0A8H7BUY2_9FUNG|nr:hypothetical protein EC973_006720 [Apophysomyces ossiformis]
MQLRLVSALVWRRKYDSQSIVYTGRFLGLLLEEVLERIYVQQALSVAVRVVMERSDRVLRIVVLVLDRTDPVPDIAVEDIAAVLHTVDLVHVLLIEKAEKAEKAGKEEKVRIVVHHGMTEEGMKAREDVAEAMTEAGAEVVRLKTSELEDFFSQAGRVRDARIIADRNSKRSKGVGYVEFYEEGSVQNALAMSGQKLLGIPVLVQLTEAEKNRIAMQAQQNALLAARDQEMFCQRLYVGSLHFSLTEDDVRQIFEPFGPLEFVDLHKDPETGRSKGFAFIQHAKDAKEALNKMNGFEVAGRNLKVGLVTDKSTGLGYGLDDEDDSAGIALNSLSRAELMKKLAARQTDLMEEDNEPVMPLTAMPNIPVSASRTVMLNNMFNPEEWVLSVVTELGGIKRISCIFRETEPNWVRELESDVKEECLQYGSIDHIHVNDDSMGEVYLKFSKVDSAEKAFKALNGRWFGGKQITASYVPEAIYNAKFSLN